MTRDIGVLGPFRGGTKSSRRVTRSRIDNTVRRRVALLIPTYAVVAFLALTSEQGPEPGWPRVVTILVALSTLPVAAAVMATRRMFVWWEPQRTHRYATIAFTLYADVGVTTCLFLMSSRTLALVCTVLFAVISPLVAFFTNRATVAVHLVFSTVVIAALAYLAVQERPEDRQALLAGALAIWLACNATMTIVSATSVALHDALEHQLDRARTDPLTGLLNMRGLHSTAVRLLEPSGPPVGFLLIDLDHFKTVNDRYGHIAGDEVLARTAGRIEALVGEGPLIARRGGEEFLVVVQQENLSLMGMAQWVRRGLQVPTDPVPVTVSIGVAAVCPAPENDRSMYDVINIGMHYADIAMYRAKAAGRNRVVEHYL